MRITVEKYTVSNPIDLNGAHPVERYKTEKAAKIGHGKRVCFAKTGEGKTVLQLEVKAPNREIKLHKCGKEDYIEL